MATRTNELFDAHRKKEVADYILTAQYDDKKAMGNVGYYSIKETVRCWFKGFYVYDALVPKWIDWIDKALERNEEFGMNQEHYHVELYRSRALGRWMVYGDDDKNDWNMAAIELKKCFETSNYYRKGDKLGEGLNDYMAYAVQAENYQAGIDMYEEIRGRAPKISLSAVLSPQKLGYAICQDKLGIKQYDKEKLFEAGRKMLQYNLQGEWLGTGIYYMAAAMWLKIIYWQNDKKLTPHQTILKAYENMPDVPTPGFIQDIIKGRRILPVIRKVFGFCPAVKKIIKKVLIAIIYILLAFVLFAFFYMYSRVG
jgi:hypothetical protein